MSIAGRKRRRSYEIKQKHKRQAKIAKLKERYRTVDSDPIRKAVLEKILKLSPNYPIDLVTAKKK
jgi:hypothetical protein